MPPELQSFFRVGLGMEWPESDEAGLRAIQRAWQALSDALGVYRDEVAAGAKLVDDAMDGDVARASSARLGHDFSAALTDLALRSGELAGMAKTAALNVQKTKIIFVAMAALALATVLTLIYSFLYFLIPAVKAAAQVGLRAALRKLITSMTALTAKELALATAQLAKHVAILAGTGGAFMGGLDLSVQIGQIMFSDRSGVDWSSVGYSTLGGMGGGAAAGIAFGASRGVRALVRSELKAGETFAPRSLVAGKLGDVAGQVIATPVGNVFANLATGGKGGVWGGFLGAGGGGRTTSTEAPKQYLPVYSDSVPPGHQLLIPAAREELPPPAYTPGDRLAAQAERARRRLGKLRQTDADEIYARAAHIVSRHHRIPVILDGVASAPIRRLRELIDDVEDVIAEQVHHSDAKAAAASSSALADELGTRRTTGLPGGGAANRTEWYPETEAGPSNYAGSSSSAIESFLAPAVELQQLPPAPSARTEQVRTLTRVNGVVAESIDGTAIRADVRQLLTGSGVPAAQTERILSALTDLSLRDNFKLFAHEGYVVTDGHGPGAVELALRGEPGDDTSGSGVAVGPPDQARRTNQVSGGAYSSVTKDAVSAPRRQGALGSHLSAPVSDPPIAWRTVDPSFGIKGVTSQPSWRTSATGELQTATSVTPPDKWTGGTFDLHHGLVLTRAGLPDETTMGTQPGGVGLSVPEVLHGLRPADGESREPAGPRATFLSGDRRLFTAIGDVVRQHPAWAEAMNSPGSAPRADVQTLSGSAALSQAGEKLVAGGTLTRSLKLTKPTGGALTAVVEISATMTDIRDQIAGPRSDDGPSAGTVTAQGRGHRGETSATVASRSPFDVNGSLGFGLLWSIHDQPSQIFGDRLDLRFDVSGFRSAAESRETTRTEDTTASTTWSSTGELRARISDVVYDIRVRFDDGVEASGKQFVPDGRTTWSVAADHAEVNDAVSATFDPRKVLGAAETKFPGAEDVRGELRKRLPEGVLPTKDDHSGHSAAADNETLLSSLVSPEGFKAHSADLNGDGLSFLLVRETHELTNRPSELVHVLIRAVGAPTGPRREDATEAPPQDGLSGEINAKRKVEQNASVEASITAGGSGGVLIGAGSAATVRSYELSGGANRSFGSRTNQLGVTQESSQGHGWSASGVTRHTRTVGYRVTIRNAGNSSTFLVSGGIAETTIGGRTSFDPPRADGNTTFSRVDHAVPSAPSGWSPGSLPDHFAVHGLDLPPGIPGYLANKMFGGLKAQHLAEHQLYVFAGRDRLAARLDQLVTGTYRMPLHRYGRQEGEYTGFGERLGEAGLAIELSNPRIDGPPRKTTLTFTSGAGSSVSHGAERTSRGYTYGNGRSGIAGNSDGNLYAFPQLGYGRFGSDSQRITNRAEQERSRRTTYSGDAYLVTYDATVLLSVNENRHFGLGPYDSTSAVAPIRAEAHRRDAVQVWVPAEEIGQIGLKADELLASPTADARLLRPHAYDVTDAVSLRPETTRRLIGSIEQGLSDLVSPAAAAPSWFTLVSWAGAKAGQLVFGAGDRQAVNALFAQVLPDLAPGRLARLLPELVAGGKTWRDSFAGPLGAIDIDLVLKARVLPGEFERTTDGWSDVLTAREETKQDQVHAETVSHSANFAFRMPLYLPHPLVRGIGPSGQSGLSANTTLTTTETTKTQKTGTASLSGDSAIYRHDIEFTVELSRTARLGRAVRSLTGGLTDYFTGTPASHRPANVLVPDSVRTRALAAEIGEDFAHGVLGSLPATAYIDVPGRAVAGIVTDVLDGVPVAEGTGVTPRVPREATAARNIVETATAPAALAAALPRALTSAGHRIEGLDADPFYAAGLTQRNPLAALVLHAELAEAWVHPSASDDATITATEVTDRSVRQDRSTGPMWNSLFASLNASLFPKTATSGQSIAEGLVPGTSLVDRPELRAVGPVLSWMNTTGVGSGGVVSEQNGKTTGPLYRVRAQVTWQVTPEYRGTEHANWTRERTASELVSFRTDADGLRTIGLPVPETSSR
ncbi:hypothetical protein DMC64_20470 [Amycolatopsis sp. WAC 04197]|nr:hypothetical protein DMC64_20470 [Amycolatopsis sp. WAC 04197]